MAGCRRLLALFSLIVSSPALIGAIMFAQEAGERLPSDRLVTPALAPKLPLFNPLALDLRPTAPVWIPPPVVPRRYPVNTANPGVPQDVFRQLVRSAGIIFSGRVTAVGPGASTGHDHAATTVTFQVEHALRGTLPNQSVTIHEWAGLWDRGERYRVGERVLLFLYGPSKLGFTSPVAGSMGRFAMDSQDRIVMSPVHVAAFAGKSILAGKSLVSYRDFDRAIGETQPSGGIEP